MMSGTKQPEWWALGSSKAQLMSILVGHTLRIDKDKIPEWHIKSIASENTSLERILKNCFTSIRLIYKPELYHITASGP